MKIYDELIIDIESGAVVSETSHEYDGPLMLCGGGGNAPAPPQKTETEKALDVEQLEMIREQRAATKEMEPFMLESMGYVRNAETGKIEKSTVMTPEKILLRKNLLMAGYDEQGNLLTEEQQLAGMNDSEKLSYKSNKLNQQRQMDAMEGKLAISPALEESLSAEEAQAREVLARKLGKDWMLSTPGQGLMKTISQKNDLVREEARRGLIGTTQAVSDSKSNQNRMQESNRASLAGIFASGISNDASNASNFATSKMGSFDGSLSLSSKYASERANAQNLAMQRYATDSAASSSMTTAAIGVAGTVGAAAAAAAAL